MHVKASKFLIYGLVDPETLELRYVGYTSIGLKRAAQHLKPSELKKRKTHKQQWLGALISRGVKPVSVVLYESISVDGLYEKEQTIIAFYRALGCRLTNGTDGGPSPVGAKRSNETRARIGAAVKVHLAIFPRKPSNETKQRMRERQLGRIHTAEARENMSKAHGGRPFVETTTGQIFNTQGEAAKTFRIAQASVWRVLNGKRRATNGLVFVYLE